jgi:hypothetical protein
MRHQAAEHPVVATKSGNADGAKRVRCEAESVVPTGKGRSTRDKAKPFCISRVEVWEAYKRVKSNKGAAGIDEQTIAGFEENLKNNLYKVWNRMTSGSYFPPPVRTVRIPKANGGERLLGIPTVSDRIAQMVVKNRLEPRVDPLFHPDSYGYRPKKSAHDAVGRARQQCWAYDWVCDLDIQGFFDNLDHDLMMRAVRKHAREKWEVLYIERWLKMPAQDEEGNLQARERGCRKEASSAHCWPTCFCIMRSICGCGGSGHICRLSGTLTMSSCTAERGKRRTRYVQ